MTSKISVLSGAQRKQAFGDLVYSDVGGGRIAVSPSWIAANIVDCCLAKADGQGSDVDTRCHRLAKEPLERAFEDLAASGLWRLIHSFDGLWVPRHMTWNPDRPLSSHSWGIAFDINASRNPYGGGVTPENRALNATFNRYGFAWGGDWNPPKDAMHWELADTLAWKSQSPDSPSSPIQPPSPRLILAVARDGAFSYHAVPDAHLWQGHFEVKPAEVADTLGLPVPDPVKGVPVTGVPVKGTEPLRDVLDSLQAQVIKLGDNLSDAADPRYYVFLRLPDSAGGVPLAGSASG